MVGGGVLLVAAIAFVGLYKLNVKKVDNTPPVPTLGIPDKGALKPPAPTAMTPVAPSAAASLPGTRVEADGAVVVVEPDQCTYLKLHLVNLARNGRQGCRLGAAGVGAREAGIHTRTHGRHGLLNCS